MNKQEKYMLNKLRYYVFKNKEINDPKLILFSEIFIDSFLKRYSYNNSRIKIPNTWNIKAYSILSQINQNLFKKDNELIKLIFLLQSVSSKEDSKKFAWLPERISQEFKDIIFNDKRKVESLPENIVLFESSRYLITLDSFLRKVILLDKKQNNLYEKEFDIRDLDLFPSQREIFSNLI